MRTGQQILKTIQSAVQTATSDAHTQEAALSQLTYQLSENRREQARACQQLASIRLDDIQRESIKQVMYDADTQARSLLKQRKNALADVNADIGQYQQLQESLELERTEQANVVERHAQKLVDAEVRAQSQLDSDTGYQSQLQVAKQADTVADSAEQKTLLADEDRQHKGKPFESDSLFMYLWNRDFGLPTYKGGGIFRVLDRWVAGLCDYDHARVNYWTLLELPKRLRQHSEKTRESADKQLVTLQVMERVVAEKLGATAAKDALEKQQMMLSEIDQKSEQAENTLIKLTDQRGHFNAGTDTFYQQAIDLLAKALESQQVVDLQRLANRTLTTDDDQLVAALIDLREEERDLQTDIDQHRGRQQVRVARLRELEQVRQKFRRKRFDDLRSGFTSGDLIESTLQEFLRGMLSSQDLWRTIERYQRHRDVGAWPDYGSGGLGDILGKMGTRKRGNTWHWPGGFRLPRSGGSSSRGRSNGGFRSGGGNRGGGFRTGGGF